MGFSEAVVVGVLQILCRPVADAAGREVQCREPRLDAGILGEPGRTILTF